MVDSTKNTSELPLHRLRNATSELHSSLDSLTDWQQALSSASNYLNLLSAYLRAVEPADAAAAQFLSNSGIPSDFEPCVRTRWLQADIDAVSQDTNGVIQQQFSNKPSFDCITTIPEAIGIQYVLEGSSLGGQILSKRLSSSLGYTPVNGGRFFAGYGDQIFPRWKAFSSWANQQLKTESQVAHAQQAAIYTFRCFMDSFSELSHE